MNNATEKKTIALTNCIPLFALGKIKVLPWLVWINLDFSDFEIEAKKKLYLIKKWHVFRQKRNGILPYFAKLPLVRIF